MNIKPIETHYAGHRFRSRLEARWAVFFDTLGIKWQYEPQGYTVGPAKRPYLPDFYLPKLECVVEVKGEKERLDLDLLANFLDGSRDAHTVLVLGDIPARDVTVTPTHLMLYRAFDIRSEPGLHQMIREFGDVLEKLEEADREAVNRFVRHKGRQTIAMTQAAFFYGSAPVVGPLGIMPSLPTADIVDPLSPLAMPVVQYSKVADAYEAARCARFEHGETP
jgi:hypothetical protein